MADDGTVHGVIVCNNWCAGRTLPGYMGCEKGCRLIVQGQQTDDGNVAGWHGPDVKYNDDEKRFTLPGGGSISAGARMDEAVFPTTTTSTTIVVSSSSSNPDEGESSTIETAVDVVRESSTTTPATIEPAGAGESVVLVDDEPVAAVTRESAAGVHVTAGDVFATISPVSGGDSGESASDSRASEFSPGDALQLDVAGLQPNSTADITIHSEPRRLGTMMVDPRGRLVAIVQIPVDMPSGNHTVVVKGFGGNGEAVELRFGVVVAGRTGVAWQTWVLVLSIIGMLYFFLRRAITSRTP